MDESALASAWPQIDEYIQSILDDETVLPRLTKREGLVHGALASYLTTRRHGKSRLDRLRFIARFRRRKLIGQLEELQDGYRSAAADLGYEIQHSKRAQLKAP